MHCQRFAPRLSLCAATLCLILCPRSSSLADSAGTPPADDAVETRTGSFQEHWAKPNWTEFAQRTEQIYNRYGWTMPKETKEDLLSEIQNSKQGSDTGMKGDPLAPKSADPLEPKANSNESKNKGAKEKEDDDLPVYEVYVPDSYKPGKKYGLMVWIAPNDTPTVPADWTKVLDQRHMIFIAPHGLATFQGQTYRTFMVGETILHAEKAFGIDEARIYVGGTGNTGAVASEIAQAFPDILQGVLCCYDARFYKDMPAGSNGMYWPGFWERPDQNLVNLDRHQSRFVLVTNSKAPVRQDGRFMRLDIKNIYDAMRRDGFGGATLLEAPQGNRGNAPDGDLFSKAMDALDAPLTAGAEQQYREAIASEKAHRMDAAYTGYTAAAARGGTASFVADADAKADAIHALYRKDLDQVEQLITDKQFEKAIAATNKLRLTWGNLARDKCTELMHQIGEARSAKK